MHLFNKENIWSNPHAFCIHPVIQTSTIILQTELFPKKRREKIQGEILQSIFKYSVSTRNPATPSYSTRTTVFLHTIQQVFQSFRAKTTILHTELILPQEILQLQGSSHADYYKASSSDCSPCIQAFYTAEQGSQLPYSTPGPHGTSRLPVNSTWQKQHSKWQPASTQPLQQFPGQANSTRIQLVLQNSTRRNRIHFKRVKYCMSMQY